MSAISIIEPEAPIAAEPAPSPIIPPAAPEQPSGFLRIAPLVAVVLAAVASFLAVIGLVVAARTVAGASLVVADARERQAQLVQVAELVEEVEGLRLREQAALERIERFRSAGAATPEDVNRAIDNLKQAMAKRDPEGGALGLVRDGQSELAERIGQIALKLERVELGMKAGRKQGPNNHP